MNYYVARQLSRAIDKLTDELREIRTSIKESSDQQVSAIRDASEAQGKTQEAAHKKIQIGLSELRVPENEKKQQSSYRKMNFVVQVILAIGTIGAFVAAAVYAGIAAKQKAVMDNTYGEIQKQTKAAQGAAQAAQSAAQTAKTQLELSERPWIVVDSMVATSPLKFLPNGRANINLSFHIKNIGHSIAAGISLRPVLMANVWGPDLFDKPFRQQANWCDKVRKESPEPRSLRTLFPEEDAWEPMGLELAKEEIMSSSSTFPDGLKGKVIEPIVYGCINYQFSFSKDVHQTRFMFTISRPQPANGAIPPNIHIGEDVPTTDMVTPKYFFGGTFAD